MVFKDINVMIIIRNSNQKGDQINYQKSFSKNNEELDNYN